jgi:hypothetical protein
VQHQYGQLRHAVAQFAADGDAVAVGEAYVRAAAAPALPAHEHEFVGRQGD